MVIILFDWIKLDYSLKEIKKQDNSINFKLIQLTSIRNPLKSSQLTIINDYSILLM